MNALLLLSVLTGQFANDSNFPQPMQQKALESTVRVFQPATRNEGSGVVVSYKEGIAYILTAAHILPVKMPDGDEVEIAFFPQGKQLFTLNGSVRDRMTNEDVAVIVVTMKNAPLAVAALCPKSDAPSKTMDKPMPVLTVGLNKFANLEAIADKIQKHKLVRKPGGSEALHWEAEREQAEGRSGGPMFDADGRVIGLASGRQDKKGYYISIYEIHAILKKKGWGFLLP